MDLEKFGEIMDDFLKEYDNVHTCIKFYFLLDAIPAIVKEMKADMGINEKEDPEDWEKTVDAILGLVKAELMEG